MVSGFNLDPMHLVFAGGFKRKLKGIVSVTTEGKISPDKLASVDQRLKLFERCKPAEFDRKVRPLSTCVDKYKMHELRDLLMYYLFPVFHGILQDDQLDHMMLLQYAMMLMGEFNQNPVSQNDLDEATRVLKLYVETLKDANCPIRPTDHAMIHMPLDGTYFKCGVECQSAFFYENFYRFFRTILRSGNKPLEQIRNRLIQRSKYLLPTSQDGYILETKDMFRVEVKKWAAENSGRKVALNFTSREHKNAPPTRTLFFPGMEISNEFPNNVFLLNNGSVVVCTDFIEYPTGSGMFKLVGSKFLSLYDAHTTPFISSKFQKYIASNLDSGVDEWNVTNIKCKMFAFPYKLSDYSVLPNICESRSPHKWYVTPIRHTLK